MAPNFLLYSCCRCNRTRNDGAAKCPACRHPGYCCLHCKFEVAPEKWSSATGGYFCENEETELGVQDVPMGGMDASWYTAIRYPEYINYPQEQTFQPETADEETTDEETDDEETVEEGNGDWISTTRLLEILVGICFIIMVLSWLHRGHRHQADKLEKTMAESRRQTMLQYQEGRIAQLEAFLESRRGGPNTHLESRD